MAKSKKPKVTNGGPYLAAAFFCEKTIEDKQDSTLSAIRIIDNVELEIDASAPPDFPSETNKLRIALNGLLSFKTGDSPGDHTIRLDVESPSGKVETVLEQTLTFSEPPYGGSNFRLNAGIGIIKGGLFVVDVFLDGKLMTRMPIQILVRRANLAQQTAPSAG
jgi:hypothetical protein